LAQLVLILQLVFWAHGVHCGIRKKEILGKEEDEKHRGGAFKKEVAACHGFRKFFTTQLINTKINPEIREMLLGHMIGLASVFTSQRMMIF
jgi:hypothetical protein